MNKKGFVLTETLAVTVFLVTIFTFIYVAVIPLIGKYRDMTERENNIDVVYKLYHIRGMLLEDGKQGYLDSNNVTKFDCSDLMAQTYCGKLMNQLELSENNVDNYELYYTKNVSENINDDTFSDEIKNYLSDYKDDDFSALVLLDKSNHSIAHIKYSDKNIMNVFPDVIQNEKNKITAVYFRQEPQDVIDTKYNAASIKANVTYKKNGKVLAWLEPDPSDSSKYVMYVECKKLIYLYTGEELFKEFSNVKTIDFQNVDTSLVTSMYSMFCKCNELEHVNVDNFDTSKVTMMGYLFWDCKKLITVDVSHFDTSKVSSMYYMFAGCYKLTNLDVSHFNTENVGAFGRMFQGCSNLLELDVSNFKTGKSTRFEYMFAHCNRLTSLDVSNFDTKNAEYMNDMFNSCSNLTLLDVSHFNTKKVKNMEDMFGNCRKLTSLDVSNFNTINVTNMRGMFAFCKSLTALDLSSFDTRKVTEMGAYDEIFNDGRTTNSGMFEGCTSLVTLDISSFDTGNVTIMGKMFADCPNLKTIYVSNKFVVNIELENYKFDMFLNSVSLVGGNGTTYSSSHADSEYARVDTASTPGYFTLKTS